MRRMLAVEVFNALLVPRRDHGGDGRGRRRRPVQRSIASRGRWVTEYSLIIFPEGTRGDGETVAPFKSGLYYLCLQKPDVQLVPAYIENLNRILPKGEFLPVPFICRVNFGPPTFLRSCGIQDRVLGPHALTPSAA